MALNEAPAVNSAGHVADHAALKAEYDAAGATPAITAYTAASTDGEHAAIHTALHTRHNTLGAVTFLPVDLTPSSPGNRSVWHPALHRAYNLRQAPAASGDTSATFPTNGAGVPAGWTQVVGLGSVAVANGQLALTSPAGVYAGAPAVLWSALAPIADFEVTYDVGVPSLAEQYPTYSFRADAANGNDQYPLNGLGFEFQPAQNHWVARQVVGGVKTPVGAGDFTFVAGTRVNVRERFVGPTWQVRIWNATPGAVEPTAWTMTATVSLTATGRMFVGGNNGSDGLVRTHNFDNVVITPVSGGAAATTSMPAAEPVGFTRIWSEDFDAAYPVGAFAAADDPNGIGRILSTSPAYARYGSKFSLYPDGNWDTGHFAKYMPSKTVSTRTDVPGANGVFDVFFHTETINGVATALAAWLRPLTVDDVDQRLLYGRFSMRMRADSSAVGYGAVQLLIGAVWPNQGEHDWPEGAFGAIEGYYHFADAAGGQQTVSAPGFSWNDWHNYTIEWIPNLAKWSVDSTVTLNTTDRVGSARSQYVLQSGGNGQFPPASASGHLQVDWITVARYG